MCMTVDAGLACWSMACMCFFDVHACFLAGLQCEWLSVILEREIRSSEHI